jgi:hypothetical protein
MHVVSHYLDVLSYSSCTKAYFIDLSFYSSTPNQSNLIGIGIMVLKVGNVMHTIIQGNSAIDEGTSIIDIDARTKRISIILSHQIFTGVPVSGTGSMITPISVEGLAQVIDKAIEGSSPLGREFSLDLELVERVSRSMHAHSYCHISTIMSLLSLV